MPWHGLIDYVKEAFNMIKKMFFFYALLFLLVSKAEGFELNHAAQLYHKEQFQEAFDAYNHIDQKNASIFFNMGNCLFYQKKYPEAIILWREAQKRGSRIVFEKARYTVDQLKKEYLHLAITPKTKSELLFEFTRSLDLLFLQILVFLLCIIFVLWLVWNRRSFVTGIIFAALLIMT